MSCYVKPIDLENIGIFFKVKVYVYLPHSKAHKNLENRLLHIS